LTSEAPEVKRIITHSGPAHADDFLAVSVLLTRHKKAEVIRVPEYGGEPQDGEVVVDVGRRYDGVRLFDHHQDPELPCSFMLVLRDLFGVDITSLPKEFKYVDLRDRFGHADALKKLGGEYSRGLIESAMLKYFSRVKLLTPSKPLHYVMRCIGKSVFNLLDDFKTAKESVRFYGSPEGYVALTRKIINPSYILEAHPEKKIIGVIMPSREGGTMLVRVGDNKVFRPKATSYPKSFIHNSGFMVVIPKSLEEIDPLQIVMECVLTP